ncbi:hypothetical protein M758_4G268000 [Ceratodon purpureus]|nr:hypothetical protein M758_4G267800 [Ceratodon purpureus]KAG0621088.1 hypothetical protein M758_4G268000 [Ceratodon purpureus]
MRGCYPLLGFLGRVFSSHLVLASSCVGYFSTTEAQNLEVYVLCTGMLALWQLCSRRCLGFLMRSTCLECRREDLFPCSSLKSWMKWWHVSGLVCRILWKWRVRALLLSRSICPQLLGSDGIGV